MHRRVRFSHSAFSRMRVRFPWLSSFARDFLLYVGAVIAILLFSLAASLYLHNMLIILWATALIPASALIFLVFTFLFPRRITESFYDT